MIGRWTHWFYCLNLWEAGLLLAAGTVVFLLLDRSLCRDLRWQLVRAGLLLLLAAVVIYLTIGTRTSASSAVCEWALFHSYREAAATGNREIYRSNLMNAALFYPLGLLLTTMLPERWRWKRCVLAVLLLTAASVAVEYVQFRFGFGQSEIDDVLHNAVGALLGALAAQNRFRKS